jgi:HlyD family secretion protein
MKRLFTIKNYILAHKIISGIALAVLLGATWYAYGVATSIDGQMRYVLGTVSTSTIITTVSASGQVSATNQVDIKPKVTGEVTRVWVKAGDTVAAGQALASIDSTDASQAVVNARIALQAEELTLSQQTSQAPIDYQKTQDAVTQAQLDLANTYDSTYSALSNAFATLPGVMSSAHDLLYASTLNPLYNNVDAYENFFISSDDATQSIVRLSANRANQDYSAALASYNATYVEFKNLTRSSPVADVEKVLSDANTTVKLISQALGSDVNLIDTTVNLLTQHNLQVSVAVTGQQTIAHTQLASVNSVLSQVSSQVTSLQSAKTSLTNAQQALQIASIGNPNGTNPFSLKLEQNAVEQKRAALATAQQSLADHTVRAPFAGVLSAVNVQVGDTAGGAAIATIITHSQVAQISVNEVDAAKISVGQKVTLTFDAIDSLTLTGTVAQIDTVGTVSQGVVSYAVKMTLDTQSNQIKPGMTVNASIQTAVHQEVLAVPSSAVKTTNGVSYAQVFNPPLVNTGGIQGVVSAVTPTQVLVETGISDDTQVEILSGLTAGEQIVTRTITGAAATTEARTTTTGAARGGIGGIRIGG